MINPLELACLRAILEGELDSAATSQLADTVSVVKRHFSDVGYDAKLTCSSAWKTRQLRSGASAILAGAQIEHSDLLAGGFAILFVKDGLPDLLEIYAHEGSWPNSIEGFTVNREAPESGEFRRR